MSSITNFFSNLFGSSKNNEFEEFKKLSDEEKLKVFKQKKSEILKTIPNKKTMEFSNGLTGLKNLGNTCFMSAAL